MTQEHLGDGVLRLLEEAYLDAANPQTKMEYSRLSDGEKRPVLLAFAESQAERSGRWAEIARDLRSAIFAGCLWRIRVGFHEVTVELPRFRIVWLMVAVAIAALDFALIRAMLGFRPSNAGVLLVFGALPMANVLVAGLLAARYRPGSRPYLLGFEAFGTMALALYISLVVICPRREGPIRFYMDLIVDALGKTIGINHPLFSSIAVFLVVLTLGFPQIAFAAIGGLLSRRYRITITRRPAPVPLPEWWSVCSGLNG
jgi:hypothetical protein